MTCSPQNNADKIAHAVWLISNGQIDNSVNVKVWHLYNSDHIMHKLLDYIFQSGTELHNESHKHLFVAPVFSAQYGPFSCQPGDYHFAHECVPPQSSVHGT